MKDRSLRNDDIEGSKPKSFTKKKLLIKQQQEQASIFNYPYVSNIQNNPIGQYIQTENSKINNKLRSPDKTHYFQNNIFGFDANAFLNKNKEENNRIDKNMQNFPQYQEIDSLDEFQKGFGAKNLDFPQMQDNSNIIYDKELNKNLARFYGVTPSLTPSNSFKPTFLNNNNKNIMEKEQVSNLLMKELAKNDKCFEKNLKNFFGLDEQPNTNQSQRNKIETSPSRNMLETNYSQFLKMQREMDNLKHKLKNGRYNPITNQQYH